MMFDRRIFFYYLKLNRPDWYDFVQKAWAAGLKSSDTRTVYEVSDEHAQNVAKFIGVKVKALEWTADEPKLEQMTVEKSKPEQMSLF